MAMPVDLVLGIAIPFHFQISGHMLVTDYSQLLLPPFGGSGPGMGDAARAEWPAWLFEYSRAPSQPVRKAPWPRLSLFRPPGKSASVQYALRMVVTAITGLTMVGLTKLNLQGPGLSESVKSLWRAPPEK